MHSLELLTLAAGVMAGFLGALLGIGGGVLLVPLLNGLLGLSFAEARGVSLIGVLGTSSSAVMVPPGRRFVNPRLAIFLLFFSVSGALIGAKYLSGFPERTYEVIFGVTMAAVAIIMLGRRNTRNVLPAATEDLGIFGGRIHDDDSCCDVAYRVKRLPLASAVAFLAGVLASLIGIGGGIVIVPTLNSLLRRADARRGGDRRADDWRDGDSRQRGRLGDRQPRRLPRRRPGVSWRRDWVSDRPSRRALTRQ